MRTILQTTIKGVPVQWARARGGGGYRDEETGLTVRRQASFHTAPAQKRFKNLVRDEARLAMLTAKARRIHDGKPVPLGTPVVFEALVYLPVPSSFNRSQERQALDGVIRPTGKPDLDNWLKLPMDACEGIAYANDSQVVGFGNSATWYSDHPRLELHVYHADPPGPADGRVERMGEALFALSDHIRRAGLLLDPEVHAAYEAVVAAWSPFKGD